MAFDPKKHMIGISGKKYLPVSARLVWFREEKPDWTIETEAVRIDTDQQFAIFRAIIRNPEGRIIATATKMENVKGFADYLEKAESGSVGRALAMCGYGTQFAPELAEGERYADSPVATGNTGGRGTYGGPNRAPGSTGNGYANRGAAPNSRMVAAPGDGGYPSRSNSWSPGDVDSPGLRGKASRVP